MNTLSRTLAGGAMIILGLVLIVVGYLISLFIWIYGIPILIIGLFIFFNKKEDEIERRKDLK